MYPQVEQLETRMRRVAAELQLAAELSARQRRRRGRLRSLLNTFPINRLRRGCEAQCC